MGCDFVMIYGQTEMSGMICQTYRDDSMEHRTQSVGYPLGPINVRICAPDPREPLAGRRSRGDLLPGVQRLCRLLGRTPAATEEVLSPDGWFRTGDLGTIRHDGYLTINGRLKDMLIRGGENIYPREIEDQLIEHPDVAEVAVVGVPDPRVGRGDRRGGPAARRSPRRSGGAAIVPRDRISEPQGAAQYGSSSTPSP